MQKVKISSAEMYKNLNRNLLELSDKELYNLQGIILKIEHLTEKKEELLSATVKNKFYEAIKKRKLSNHFAEDNFDKTLAGIMYSRYKNKKVNYNRLLIEMYNNDILESQKLWSEIAGAQYPYYNGKISKDKIFLKDIFLTCEYNRHRVEYDLAFKIFDRRKERNDSNNKNKRFSSKEAETVLLEDSMPLKSISSIADSKDEYEL